jgi:hypothetical protein
MVISHEHKYLFIEIPYTGSTAIHRELCENYAGFPTLHKHALYSEFQRIASPEEKRGFVFAGVRNPLDAAVSIYFKYRINHKGKYTNPKRLAKHGGNIGSGSLRKFDFIRNNNADFPIYFEKFYKLPYGSLISLAHRHCDSVIRFEDLQDDFSKVLKLMEIKQKRPLPQTNRTSEKGDDFLSYYTPEIIEQARRVFGPFMKKWGYDFPSEWGDNSVSWLSQIEFYSVDIVRNLYWRCLRWGPHSHVRSLILYLRSIRLGQG